MENDLISRSALIKTIQEKFNNFDFNNIYNEGLRDGYLNSIYAIQDAPTVEQPQGNISDDYLMGYLQGCKDTRDKINASTVERPQGEWIKSKDGYFRCDQCGSRGSAIKARFCHHCGAQMKGGAE